MPPSAPLNIPALDRDLHLYIHGAHDRHVSRRIREQGIWEPYETELVCALLSPGDVFVDVGANIGYFTLLAAALVGETGRVFAFEPDPDNYKLLRASLARNGLEAGVEAVQGALSDADSSGALFLSEDNLGDHQVYAVPQETRQSVPINLYDGGAWLAARTGRVDLVKVDTQGAEYRVMTGLLPWLRSLDPLPRILVELTPLSLRQAGSSGRALVELLGSTGQPLWIVDHIEHRLVASDVEALATWCDNVDAWEGDQGFMNILVGAAPQAPVGGRTA
ncbi:MAG: methyltransferase FkbM [Halioglobus sp.]|nr:methyltransferase FkbM [Halioglobus sp.]|tara:strand:+ start:159 stop:989 length:831 start_codon:yes stop_codon:yes gene_type:complete